jgi:hypothetical protein
VCVRSRTWECSFPFHVTNNPSFFSSSSSPADSEATAPSSERFQEPVQLRRNTRTDKLSCIENRFQSDQAAHPDTSIPRLAPSLQAPGAFAKDLDEAGGVTVPEDCVPAALLKDPDSTYPTFIAKTADTAAPDPRTLVEAMAAVRSLDCPPGEKKPTEEKPDAHKARPVAQGLSQMRGVDTHAKVGCLQPTPGILIGRLSSNSHQIATLIATSPLSSQDSPSAASAHHARIAQTRQSTHRRAQAETR